MAKRRQRVANEKNRCGRLNSLSGPERKKTFYRLNLNFTIKRLHQTAIVSHRGGLESAFCRSSSEQQLFSVRVARSLLENGIKYRLVKEKESFSATIVSAASWAGFSPAAAAAAFLSPPPPVVESVNNRNDIN